MENKEEFERIAKEMIKYLCDNHHPHTHVVIDCNSAVLAESAIAFTTDEFIRD